MDWTDLTRIEPYLAELERDAKRIGVGYSYSNYELMKDRMFCLVGWSAENPALRSPEAWDIAMEHIALRCAP